jgi:uncharacterized membrane protein
MNELEINEPATGNSMPKLPIAGAVVALAGLADAAYLTVHHLTAEPVPCNIVAGCETVLTSSYAVIGDIPLAAFGAAAYFIAFSLALLSAFGNRMTWTLFGIQVVLMSVFTVWLLYLQGFVIGAFCQFCLISALTTFTMLIIYIASRFVGRS